MERHYTDHNKPWAHSDPHDHIINWDHDTGNPIFDSPINYWDGNIPEFKNFKEEIYVSKGPVIRENSLEDNRFKTISDFKWCMKCGGEVEFKWKSKIYSITHITYGISISESNEQETEKICKDVDEVLEYIVGEDCLREVITRVIVLDRTI